MKPFVRRNGIRPNGIRPNGIGPNGIRPNGIRPKWEDPVAVVEEWKHGYPSFTPRLSLVRKSGHVPPFPHERGVSGHEG